MKSIRVSEPMVDGQVVIVDVQTGDHERFVRSGKYRTRYEGFDPASVPPEILLVPAMGFLSTAAMALGAPIVAPYFDRCFAHSAEQLSTEWQRIYPRFESRHFALIGERKTNQCTADKGDLLLYSGGVDALTSLLSNRNTVAGLVSVWGADVPVDRDVLWNQLHSVMRQTEVVYHLPMYTIRTNMRKFFVSNRLTKRAVRAEEGTWWMKVQHGGALLSLAAPLAYALGYSRTLIASSHSESFAEPWGSSPFTDNLYRCSKITAKHDGFHLSRQQKISEVIAPYLRDGSTASLAVCYNSKRGGSSINCGQCEKCCRTASGFLSAGVDPRKVGLDVTFETLSEWKYGLVKGSRSLSPNEIFMWTDIQRILQNHHINPELPNEVQNYLHWLRGFDFESAKARG